MSLGKVNSSALIHGGYDVDFHFQSRYLSASDWVVVLTVCLAPLLAHLIAGVPRIIHLQHDLPRWHDSIANFNPVSIIWRYLAITERSLSTRKYTPEELAAINVSYWTGHGWAGTESVLREGKILCIQRPPPGRDRLFSIGSVKTAIVAIQGIGAIATFVPGKLAANANALDAIFLPLAFMGLVRLPAAYWLTDDHHILRPYGPTPHQKSQQVPHIHIPEISKRYPTLSPTSDYQLVATQRPARLTSVDSLNDSDDNSIQMPSYALGAWAVTVRTGFFLYLLSILGICIFQIFNPVIKQETTSLTILLMTWCYAVLLFTTILILLVHLCNRKPLSVCIPCANKAWYKVHTCLLGAMAIMTFVVAALETYKDASGDYTSVNTVPDIWDCYYRGTGFLPAGLCTRFELGTWGHKCQ